MANGGVAVGGRIGVTSTPNKRGGMDDNGEHPEAKRAKAIALGLFVLLVILHMQKGGE